VATYTRSVLVRASVEALYDFHRDTNNVKRVQPPGFTVETVELPPEISVGAPIRLTVRVLGLVRQHWRITWAEITPPTGNPRWARLVDEMIEGPFPSFRQEHLFTQEGGGARLTDRVIFQPPLGWFGRLLLPLFYLQLAGMFWWRHRRTRVLLEARGCP
jgi:ligand-binding SRPBCC domain-containing protein